MSISTQSVLFNAVPLLVLAAAYFVVAATLVPVIWRERSGVHPLDVATVLIFPALAIVAAVFGGVVLHDRRPIGGHVWLPLAAVIVAFAPTVLFVLRWRERALVAGGIGRAQEAEKLVSVRDSEVEALADLSVALAHASNPTSAALPLVERVQRLLGADFAGVVLVDSETTVASGVLARNGVEDVPWWPDLRLDLHNEPSGIASVVFGAAPIAVYDVAGSGEVNRRLVELTGAQSGVWAPILAEEQVVGVLVAATTTRRHVFTHEEIALLMALAGEAGLALQRMRSAAALAAALERERLIAAISRKIRGERDLEGVIEVASRELEVTLGLDRVSIALGAENRAGVPILVAGERVGTVELERAEPLADGERFLVETVGRELGLALETARLLGENQRRLQRQGALFNAARVVTSELELELVLERLVEEVTKLLRADGADCCLLDRERGVLECAAVYGLDPALVGFQFPSDRGAAGLALAREQPVSIVSYEELEAPVPHAAYEGLAYALVAPMVWAGEVRGVLGVGLRDPARRFEQADADLLEAFAGLASLALRNAESFAERTRQARVQRAFYRIASLLSEPLSLEQTLAAAAQAAVEAVGVDFGAVLMPEGGRLAIVAEHHLPDEIRALELPDALVEAASDERTIASPRLADDERFEPAWREAGVSSLLAIPIDNGVRGLIVVFDRAPRSYTADDLELGRHLAGATRAALGRSRAYEAERTARSLSQQLARMSSLLSTELDPAAVLVDVVEQAVALLDADAGALASLAGETLEVSATAGDGAAAAAGRRSLATGWIDGDVLQLRAPVTREDVSAATTRVETDAVLELGFRGYLGVPIAGRESALHGVLAVYSSEPRVWRDDEVEALSALAANGSVALANAELYQRLAIEHEQSAAILSNVADGIVAVDRDGRVVVWNAAAERITGMPMAEALGRTPAEVLQRELQSETGGTNRLVAISRGGEEVWLSLSETIMRDPAGAVAGRIFAFRDISDERAVEQMKSEFVSTVSHELRTPLTSIYGFAETLLRRDIGFSDAERGTFLGYIASESERLTRIVDALLNVARLDRGDLQVDLVHTDVAVLLNEAVSTGGAPALTNGHRFVVEVENGVTDVQADPAKLRQVIEQLLENAVKYSPSGAVVRLEARRRGDAVEITVADEGQGIPAAQIDRIFDKFYRGGETYPGTGLGLFIAQGLVTAMGGKLWVNSEEGAGSRFSFRLPAAGFKSAIVETIKMNPEEAESMVEENMVERR